MVSGQANFSPRPENSISRIRAIKINRIKGKLGRGRGGRKSRISRELTRGISFLGRRRRNYGKKKGRFHGSDQVETAGVEEGVSRNSLKLGAGSLYLSETWSKRRIIIGGTPRETLSSNFAGDEIPRR